MRKSNVDMTSGKLFPAIVMYSLPLALANLIVVLFTIADSAVLGQMANSAAVAAVGVTGPVTGVLVNAFIGLSAGLNIILARYLGAGNRERAQACIETGILFSGTLGLLLAAAGFFLSPYLLNVIDCPADCYDGALIYLKIYCASSPFLLLYNFAATIIRVNGDTRRPLYYMIAAGVVNVILNVVLCLVLEQKVAAVAIATFSSQMLGAFLTLRQLIREKSMIHADFLHPHFSWKELGRILRYGTPCMINGALYSLSNLQIISAINSYGSAATAGFSTSGNIETTICCLFNATSAAMVPFIGQNIGAGKPERVKKSFWCSFGLSCAIGGVLGPLVYAFGRPLLAIFVPNDPAAIEYGHIRMTYMLLPYVIAAARVAVGEALNSLGKSGLQMGISIATVLGFRVFWMFFVYPQVNTFDNLMLCYIVSWSLCLVISAVAFFFTFRKFKAGKLKKV